MFMDHFIFVWEFLFPIFCLYFYWVIFFFFFNVQIQDQNPLYFTYNASTYFLLSCHLSLNFVCEVFSPLFQFLSSQRILSCFLGVSCLLSTTLQGKKSGDSDLLGTRVQLRAAYSETHFVRQKHRDPRHGCP